VLGHPRKRPAQVYPVVKCLVSLLTRVLLSFALLRLARLLAYTLYRFGEDDISKLIVHKVFLHFFGLGSLGLCFNVLAY
jgi:hypothetical protein